MVKHSLLFKLCICLAGIFSVHAAYCQAVPDTSMKQVFPDSATAKQQEVQQLPNREANTQYRPTPSQPNPKKAGLYSAIFPGIGQIYNKQYWKLPIIYAGAGVATYFFIDNSQNYQKYRRIYISRLDNDPTNDEETLYSTAEIKTLQDSYKRWLDMTGLFTALGYTLQVLDAVVFAHLKEFDISQDISLKFQPVIMPHQGVGIGIVAHF